MKKNKLPNYEGLLFDIIGLKIPIYNDVLSYNRKGNHRSLELLIWEEIEKLPPRDQEIIGYCYAFNNEGLVLTLKEIGERMDVTPERVRQLKFRAMRFLYRNIALLIEEKRKMFTKPEA